MTKQQPAHHDEIPPMGEPGSMAATNIQQRRPNMIPLAPKAATPDAPGTALANMATQAEVAKVQAAILLAKQFPRDYVKALDVIKNACQRQGLAQEGLYEYKRGVNTVTGPSIRLAEAIAQNWGNMEFGWDELSRGRDQTGIGYSEIVAFAWDIETNVKRTTKFQVRHWRDTKEGGYPLRDERDIYENNANSAARRLRACILNLIPGDVTDEAVSQCEATLKSKINITPEKVAEMVDAFAKLGVTKGQIEKRIQSRIDAITPAQMMQMKKIYNSLSDGASTALDWFPAAEAPAEGGNTDSLQKLETKITRKKQEASVTEQAASEEKPAVKAEVIPINQDPSGKEDWSQYFSDCSAVIGRLTTPEEFTAFRDANQDGITRMYRNLRSWAERLDKMITDGENRK